MKRLAVFGVVVACGVVCAPAGAATTRLMVSGDEFSLFLSRQSVVRGPALVQFVNRGEDPHDLKLKRVGGKQQVAFPEISSRKLAERRVNLATGRYRFWCSLPGHANKGMRASLTVRR